MAAAPINWTRDSFRGRLSFGMAALAKETLEKRNIICPRNPAKKTATILNPAATAASNFEEAEEIILSKRSVVVVDVKDKSRQYVAHRVTTAKNGYDKSVPEITTVPTNLTAKKWWTRPIFFYIVLPVCAAIGGALITYLLGLLI